jgi:hypothetical protein
MAKIPCPHCGEQLTVNPDAVGSQLVCPKCRVILRLAKDDEKPSLFDLRRLLRRKKVTVGLACVLMAVAFYVGFHAGVARSSAASHSRGTVMTAVGVFFAHNELHINEEAKAEPPHAKEK